MTASNTDIVFSIKLTATSNPQLTKTFTVQINDINDIAPLFTSGTEVTIAENGGAGALVYTAQATPDVVGDTVTYSFENSGDAAAFDIDEDTGAVTLKANADYETKESYQVLLSSPRSAG